MKPILKKIDKFLVIAIIVLIAGVLSSFVDFGILSVVFSITMPIIFIINCALAIYGILKKNISI